MIKQFKQYIKELKQEKYWEPIQKLIQKVSSITNQSINEIIKNSDFNKNDKSIEKLEAILSEFRSIVFLDNIGFKNIKLLKAQKKISQVDISAEIYNKKFDIEVTCLTAFHSREKTIFPDTKHSCFIFDNDKFLKTFTDKMNGKKGKINQVKKGGSNKFKMIIIVLNRSPEKECYNLKEYKNIIKETYKTINLNKNLFLGFITSNQYFYYPDIQQIIN
jgi:hypothetical protein